MTDLYIERLADWHQCLINGMTENMCVKQPQQHSTNEWVKAQGPTDLQKLSYFFWIISSQGRPFSEPHWLWVTFFSQKTDESRLWTIVSLRYGFSEQPLLCASLSQFYLFSAHCTKFSLPICSFNMFIIIIIVVVVVVVIVIIVIVVIVVIMMFIINNIITIFIFIFFNYNIYTSTAVLTVYMQVYKYRLIHAGENIYTVNIHLQLYICTCSNARV